MEPSGMKEIEIISPEDKAEGKSGTKKIVNASLSKEAMDTIIAVILANGGKIKAEFQINLGINFAVMRIDMAGEVGRVSSHGGAKVPHAQVQPFMCIRNIKGEDKLVPFTSTVGDIQMTSEQVLQTFQDVSKPSIVEGSSLFAEIRQLINKVDTDGRKNLKNEPFIILFRDFTSVSQPYGH